jgi:hypothetical protein
MSIEGTGCAAILRSTYSSTDAFVAAHVRQTSLEQDPPERPAEVLVEDGVDDGIEGRVHVPQPEGRREGDARNVTDQSQDVHEEEGQPAGDEGAHDQTEDQGGSLLLLPGDPPLLALGIPRLLHTRHLLLDDVLLAGARLVFGGPSVFGRFPTENRLAQSQFQWFHDRTTGHHTRIRTARVELAHHVRVDAHRRLPHPGHRRRLLLQFAVHRQRRSPELALRQRVADHLGTCEHLKQNELSRPLR